MSVPDGIRRSPEFGSRTARTAGIQVALFYDHYTFGQDFPGAALVARSLEFFDLEMLGDLFHHGP